MGNGGEDRGSKARQGEEESERERDRVKEGITIIIYSNGDKLQTIHDGRADVNLG